MHVQRSIAKVKRKQENFVISMTMVDWFLHQKVFALREENCTLSGKAKDHI